MTVTELLKEQTIAASRMLEMFNIDTDDKLGYLNVGTPKDVIYNKVADLEISNDKAKACLTSIKYHKQNKSAAELLNKYTTIELYSINKAIEDNTQLLSSGQMMIRGILEAMEEYRNQLASVDEQAIVIVGDNLLCKKVDEINEYTDVDFDGTYMIQINKMGADFVVNNAMNGGGYNVLPEFKDKQVIVIPITRPTQIKQLVKSEVEKLIEQEGTEDGEALFKRWWDNKYPSILFDAKIELHRDSKGYFFSKFIVK